MRKSFPVSYTIRNDKTLSSGRLSDSNLAQKKFIQKNRTLKKININNIKYMFSSLKFSQYILTFKENIIIILF